MPPVNTTPKKKLIQELCDALTLLTVCGRGLSLRTLRTLSATSSPLYLPFQILVVGETCWARNPLFSTPSSLYDVGTVHQRPHNSRSSMMPSSLDSCLPAASSLNRMVRTRGSHEGSYHLCDFINLPARIFEVRDGGLIWTGMGNWGRRVRAVRGVMGRPQT